LENPDVSPYKLKSLKEFVKTIAYAINSIEDDDTAVFEIIRNYWNYFTAEWRRKNSEIFKNITELITNVYFFQYFFHSFQPRKLIFNKLIYNLLAEEMKFPKKKKSIKFINKFYLLHFVKQL
jgi:hypothetical protein